MLKVVSNESIQSSLDDIVREGAQRMLARALQHEADSYIAQFSDVVDEAGKRLVVRNGKAKERSILSGCGPVKVEAPRINDKREGIKFSSNILPAYARKSPNVETLLPILYLKGISTNSFPEALEAIMGEGAKGLSASSISSLTKAWETEHERWRKRKLTDEEYVYIWADGVNVQVRLGDDKKVCLLVIIGATSDGKKRLLACEAGWRESKETWKLLLDDLLDRGLNAPLVAIGDGALGFWSALRDCSQLNGIKEQRCWVHKIANVLDCFPKRLQPKAKQLLRDMMYAETKSDALKDKMAFDNAFHAKYPKAVEKLNKDWKELTTFFNYPAHHWKHLRTTNPIESSFASVKLRTKITKGAGSAKKATTMAFKLLLEAEKKWKKLNAPEVLVELMQGLEFKDGVVLQSSKTHQEATSA